LLWAPAGGQLSGHQLLGSSYSRATVQGAQGPKIHHTTQVSRDPAKIRMFAVEWVSDVVSTLVIELNMFPEGLPQPDSRE
jgi:hypothetical protein